MNVRKPADYGAMFAALNMLMAAAWPQMKMYAEIGRLVSGRSEKGAAVAAAKYLCGAYPDASGFSPRNLRRYLESLSTYTRCSHRHPVSGTAQPEKVIVFRGPAVKHHMIYQNQTSGAAGGRIVAIGTPAGVRCNAESVIGSFI